MSEIKDLQALVTRFQQDRNWDEYLLPSNVIQAMMVECAELMEIFQWVKSSDNQKILTEKKSEITDEVADVFAYLLTFCRVAEIDLAQALQQKMLKNAQKYPINKV